MKILFVGNTPGLNNIEKYYLTEQRLINGFTRLGHTTYCFNDRDHSKYLNIFRRQKAGRKQMNEKLIQSAEIYKPDLIVIGNCKNVTNATLDEIRRNLPSVRIIYRNVDPLSDIGNVRSISDRLGVVDAIFITTAGKLLKQFATSKTKVCHFPNPVDSAIDTNRSFDNQRARIDLLLLGRELRHQNDPRYELAKYIDTRNKGWINSYIGGVGMNSALHYGASYMDMLENSKMGISVSKVNDHYLYASDRLSHYLASGICTFVPKGPKFTDVLGTNALVEFDSHDDLWDKVIYYFENEKERKETAKIGHAAAHDRFCVEKVCNFMIEVAYDKPLSLPYAWPTELYTLEKRA